MAPKLFVFLGRSGCGKGTQCALLMDHLKQKDGKETFYVSTGDEFRKLIESGTYTASKVKEIVSEGNFVPSFLASMMWANVIARDYKEGMNMVIDGSPRTLSEKSIFDTVHYFFGEKKVFDFDSVNIVFMNVTKEWATARLLGRARSDDNAEAISKRMYWFEKFVNPVVESYRNEKNINFFEINGEQTIDEVHKEIVSKISS